MNDRLCFEVHDNKGYFVFPDTWFGPLLGEFEEVLDAYDADEISETSYINKLRRLAQREPDFIDIHAHLAYAFLEQNAPRKALNAALKGLAAGNRIIPESFCGEIIWMHPENRPYLRALYAAILANVHLQRHQDAIMLIEKILDYNPEDNHGARWLLGPELAALRQILTSQKYCAEICIHFHLLYGITFQAVRILPKIIMPHTTRYGGNIRKHCCL